MSEVEEEISTRDALEAAFDEIEETETEGEVDTAELAEESETEEPVAEVEETVDEEEDDEGEDETESVVEDEPEQAAESVDGGQDARPPASWTPAAREVWNDVPESARREIEKREREINVKLQETAEERKGYQAFQQAIEPFKQTIAMEANGDALIATRNLMGLATRMRFGQPHEKAALVRDIIGQYGVDIETLDSLLAGQPVSAPAGGVPPAPSSAPLPAADPRVDQMWQAQQAQQAQVQQTHAQEVDAFLSDPKNEFAQDVRLDMADMMDLASRRGQQLTLDEAYQRAIAVRQDIQQVIQSRGAPPAANQGESLKRKKRAAKQISGSPTGGGGNDQPQTLEETLSQAWDDLASGS